MCDYPCNGRLTSFYSPHYLYSLFSSITCQGDLWYESMNRQIDNNDNYIHIRVVQGQSCFRASCAGLVLVTFIAPMRCDFCVCDFHHTKKVVMQSFSLCPSSKAITSVYLFLAVSSDQKSLFYRQQQFTNSPVGQRNLANSSWSKLSLPCVYCSYPCRYHVCLRLVIVVVVRSRITGGKN